MMLYHRSPVLCGIPWGKSHVKDQVIPRYLAVAGMHFLASGVLLGKLVGLDRCAHVPPYPSTPST